MPRYLRRALRAVRDVVFAVVLVFLFWIGQRLGLMRVDDE